MPNVNLPAKYYYQDARDGTKYCATTETYDGDESPIQTGADLRFKIMNGGDHTTCQKSVGSIRALGASRV